MNALNSRIPLDNVLDAVLDSWDPFAKRHHHNLLRLVRRGDGTQAVTQPGVRPSSSRTSYVRLVFVLEDAPSREAELKDDWQRGAGSREGLAQMLSAARRRGVTRSRAA